MVEIERLIAGIHPNAWHFVNFVTAPEIFLPIRPGQVEEYRSGFRARQLLVSVCPLITAHSGCTVFSHTVTHTFSAIFLQIPNKRTGGEGRNRTFFAQFRGKITANFQVTASNSVTTQLNLSNSFTEGVLLANHLLVSTKCEAIDLLSIALARLLLCVDRLERRGTCYLQNEGGLIKDKRHGDESTCSCWHHRFSIYIPHSHALAQTLSTSPGVCSRFTHTR